MYLCVCVYRCDVTTCHLILINQSKTAFEKTASHERSYPLQQEKEKSSIDAPHLINTLIDVLMHPALIPREREQKESEEEMRPQWRSWSIIHPKHFSCPELEWIRQRVSIQIATAALIRKPYQHIREEHGTLRGRTWREKWCLNSLRHGLNTAEWNILLLLSRLSCTLLEFLQHSQCNHSIYNLIWRYSRWVNDTSQWQVTSVACSLLWACNDWNCCHFFSSVENQ